MNKILLLLYHQWARAPARVATLSTGPGPGVSWRYRGSKEGEFRRAAREVLVRYGPLALNRHKEAWDNTSLKPRSKRRGAPPSVVVWSSRCAELVEKRVRGLRRCSRSLSCGQSRRGIRVTSAPKTHRTRRKRCAADAYRPADRRPTARRATAGSREKARKRAPRGSQKP